MNPQSSKPDTKDKSLKKIIWLLAGLAIGSIVIVLVFGIVLGSMAPNRFYLRNFDAATVQAEAESTKTDLQNKLLEFESVMSIKARYVSYVDECYPDNHDHFSSWSKVCYGRIVGYYVSNIKAADEAAYLNAHQKSFKSMSFLNTTGATNSNGCYSYILDVPSLDFMGQELKISSNASNCTPALTQKKNILLSHYAIDSSLTSLVNASELESLVGDPNQMLITIGLQKQYYEKSVGTWIIPDYN